MSSKTAGTLIAPFKEEMIRHVPSNPAPLKVTSLKLMPHHYPPFKSRDEYQDWLNHGNDTKYLIEKYWNDVKGK